MFYRRSRAQVRPKHAIDTVAHPNEQERRKTKDILKKITKTSQMKKHPRVTFKVL